mmetsp:Transcript_23787/g.51944  ORF Transcript_23787/g.51944 Transcript_23787/m.51944 type:complete len:94 (-) Transcript_23787:578-859(-)
METLAQMARIVKAHLPVATLMPTNQAVFPWPDTMRRTVVAVLIQVKRNSQLACRAMNDDSFRIHSKNSQHMNGNVTQNIVPVLYVQKVSEFEG